MTIKPRNPSVIANLIRLTRQQFKGTILAVEGSTDSRLFQNLVDLKECLVLHCDGKNNVLDVVKELEGSNFEGILGIIDADFWRIMGKSSPSQNIILTDTHDLDSMLVFSTALDKVLSELIHSDKLRTLKVPIIDGVKCGAYPIGLLRLLSEQNNGRFQLNFKDMDYSFFLNKSDLSTDINLLLKNLKLVSQRPEFDKDDLIKQLDELLVQNHDVLQVCTGDDLMEIITFGLRYIFGNRRTCYLTRDLLNKDLRIAYNNEYFKYTCLHHMIERWETLNTNYKVLAGL